MGIRMSKSRSDWMDDVSKIVETMERKAIENPHKLLLRLAKNAEEYLKTWKSLGEESTVESSVGSYMVRVLNKAHDLVSCVGKGHQPSPGEFDEIIDDFRRYARIMMHRLMNKSNITDSEKSFLRELNDKVVLDCAFLRGQLSLVSDRPRQPPPLPEVCSKNLKLKGKIGSGTYATVHTARWEGSEVAVKIFADQGEDFKNELDRLKFLALDSSHILRLLGRSKNDDEKIFLILELMEGTLQDLKRTPLSITDLVEIIIQTAKGMQFLHSQNIAHRDLKPGNILLRRKYKNKLHYLVKVADFGKSKGGFFFDYTSEGERHEDAEDTHSLYQGTIGYMAPEMRSGDDRCEGKYTRLVDVFSFGITWNHLLPRERLISLSSLKDLIDHSMQEDFLQRPSFEVICEELWIVMQELLAESHPLSMEPSEDPLTDLKCEGEYKEGGTVKVSFKLVGPYCVTSWMGIKSNGGPCIFKTERFNGPAEEITSEYKYHPLEAKDYGNTMIIMISSRYLRWSVKYDGSVPTKWVIRKMAV